MSPQPSPTQPPAPSTVPFCIPCARCQLLGTVQGLGLSPHTEPVSRYEEQAAAGKPRGLLWAVEPLSKGILVNASRHFPEPRPYLAN